MKRGKCELMKMWRSDMDEIDFDNADCDGECEVCCYREEVTNKQHTCHENNFFEVGNAIALQDLT